MKVGISGLCEGYELVSLAVLIERFMDQLLRYWFSWGKKAWAGA